MDLCGKQLVGRSGRPGFCRADCILSLLQRSHPVVEVPDLAALRAVVVHLVGGVEGFAGKSVTSGMHPEAAGITAHHVLVLRHPDLHRHRDVNIT